VHREFNVLADSFAKFGLSLSGDNILFYFVPFSGAASQVEEDCVYSQVEVI